MLSRLFDSHSELTAYPTDVSLLYAYVPGFVASEYDPKKLRARIAAVLSKSLNYGLGQSTEYGSRTKVIDEIIDGVLTRLPDASLRDRGAVIRALISTWRETSHAGPNIGVVVKETSQAVHFLELRKALPDTRFLHLMRDPRDNYAAIKAGVAQYYSGFGEGEHASLASVLNRIQVDTKAAQTFAAEYPEDFAIVRFEDLVSNPERTMTEISKFAGIRYEECLLMPTVGGASYKGNSHDGIEMKGISSQNLGRWRQRISAEEAMIIEFWFGSEMEKNGYQREYSEVDAANAFSKFYDWYNNKYFYFDSFRDA